MCLFSSLILFFRTSISVIIIDSVLTPFRKTLYNLVLIVTSGPSATVHPELFLSLTASLFVAAVTLILPEPGRAIVAAILISVIPLLLRALLILYVISAGLSFLFAFAIAVLFIRTTSCLSYISVLDSGIMMPPAERVLAVRGTGAPLATDVQLLPEEDIANEAEGLDMLLTFSSISLICLCVSFVDLAMASIIDLLLGFSVSSSRNFANALKASFKKFVRRLVPASSKRRVCLVSLRSFVACSWWFWGILSQSGKLAWELMAADPTRSSV